MNLTDSEILELNELCNALVDERITDAQRARLSQWLSSSEPARQYYTHALGLSASLCHYSGEMQTEEPDSPARGARGGHRWRWAIGLTSLAASIALVPTVLWLGRTRPAKNNSPPAVVAAVPAADDDEYVAWLTGSKECQWAGNTSPFQASGRLRKGQQVDLIKGFAEITFDSGAKVLLQGPALLDVTSSWSATLKHGSLKASLPPEAIGFSISNPTVEVVDLGTEFTMIADKGGAAAEVLVLKGEVEAAPKTPADQQPIVLREKESRRFATSGVTTLHTSEEKFEELSHNVELDRFVSPIGYAHWSFDEQQGDLFRAENSKLSNAASDAQVQRGARSAGQVHTKGRWNDALRFDGNIYARAAFPGISNNAPHTIAFWVNIPKDANLASAYAMVAWASNSQKFGSHPFHIGWNRNPNEGLVGALRTDYGRGYALGSIPLRDGNWHHIAVVLIPRDDPESPMEVKQYVDGRLDGEGRPSPSGSDIFRSTAGGSQATGGTVWLGCRLGTKDVRNDRFFGEMDELFIAERALEQQEIVRLMTVNQLDE